jgi:uncharacterized membrane protein
MQSSKMSMEAALTTTPIQYPESSVKLWSHPLHPMLVTLPIGLFSGTLLFDLLLWKTQNDAFVTGGLWLLGFGLAAAMVAAMAGILDFLGHRHVYRLRDAWQHASGNGILLVVQVVNFYLRYEKGAENILPWGLLLSTIAVGLMLYTGWKGGELVFRHRVAVNDRPNR